MENTLLLIDGSSFIYRAFHAMPELISGSGEPTGAIYGMVGMFKQLQKKYPTNKIACVFDLPGKTFRDKIYPQYKANRRITPEQLVVQIPIIHKIIAALGIPVIAKNGVEADDIIGTLAINGEAHGYKVIIATGDKDFAQLVNENITLVNTMSSEVLDVAGVISKFGVKPAQIIDYLTLIGDKVDNIPGVAKCGPKTAIKWLLEFHSLENIIKNSNSVTGAVGENLRQSILWLETAKILITIDTQVDLIELIPNGIKDIILQNPQNDVLIKYYTKLGFKSWLKEATSQIVLPKVNNFVQQNLTTLEITSIDQFNEVLKLIANDIIGLVIIPNNLKDIKYIKLVVFATDKVVYIVKENEVNNLFEQNSLNYQSYLEKLFTSSSAKVLPNYKETLQILSKLNYKLNNVADDITLLHYIYNSKLPHTMSYIYNEVAALEVADLPSITSKNYKASQIIIDNQESLTKQCIDIAQNILLVKKEIYTLLDEEQKQLYKNVELPLVQVLIDIENEGITLDIDKFVLLERQISNKLKELEDIIFRLANCSFNINSPKQLQEVLFINLKLPTFGIKLNKQGYSTDEDSLKSLAKQGITIAEHLLEYRTLSKLLNTYIAKLPLIVDKENKIHTTFEQAVVTSGRLASRDPNLQNIPIKNELGKQVRQSFIAKDGYQLICADYSQIELRILAHLSNDENLINAFNTEQDIHSITASDIFNKPLAEITKDERRYAKTINFSLLYGKTAYGLALELGIERTTAKMYIDRYFANYPKVLNCLEEIKNFARKNGYVKTVYGRRIYLSNINVSNKILREAEERLALNSPMQGTSADIIKIAMHNIALWLKENKLSSKMILQVHDELIIHAKNSEVELIKNNLAKLMVQGNVLQVKLAVDIKSASNWDEAH